MIVGMTANLTAERLLALHHIGIFFHQTAKIKEGCPCVIFLQNIQNGIGCLGVRAVIVGQRNHFFVADFLGNGSFLFRFFDFLLHFRIRNRQAHHAVAAGEKVVAVEIKQYAVLRECKAVKPSRVGCKQGFVVAEDTVFIRLCRCEVFFRVGRSVFRKAVRLQAFRRYLCILFQIKMEHLNLCVRRKFAVCLMCFKEHQTQLIFLRKIAFIAQIQNRIRLFFLLFFFLCRGKFRIKGIADFRHDFRNACINPFLPDFGILQQIGKVIFLLHHILWLADLLLLQILRPVGDSLLCQLQCLFAVQQRKAAAVCAASTREQQYAHQKKGQHTFHSHSDSPFRF